jgi:hypothetical protein
MEHKSGMEVIDLCDESEAESSSFHDAEKETKKSSTTTTTTRSQQCASLESSTNVLANATSNSASPIELDFFEDACDNDTPLKRNNSQISTTAGTSTMGDVQHEDLANLSHPVTVEAKKRRKLAVEEVIELLDDDDDDDDVKQQNDDDDDDGDDLLNFSSGLRRRGASSADQKPGATGPRKEPNQRLSSKEDARTSVSRGKPCIEGKVEIDLTKDVSPAETVSKSCPPAITNVTRTPPDKTSTSDPAVLANPYRASPEAMKLQSPDAPSVAPTAAPIVNPYRSTSKAKAPLMDREASRSLLLSEASSPITREISSAAASAIATTATAIVNPYRSASKASAPSMAREVNRTSLLSDTMVQTFPKLLDTSKMYPDERARFLLAFWKYGRKNCTGHSYQRAKLDIMAKRIVKLALAEHPIRSLEEFVSASTGHKAVSELSKVRQQMTEELHEGGFDSIAAPHRSSIHSTGRRKFHSIVEAALSGFLRIAKDRLEEGHDLAYELKDKAMWLSLDDFIPIIDEHLLPCAPSKLTRPGESDHGAGYFTDKATRSMEFLQITKLETNICDGPYLKRH